jgi:hypothetical protein
MSQRTMTPGAMETIPAGIQAIIFITQRLGVTSGVCLDDGWSEEPETRINITTAKPMSPARRGVHN